MEQFRIGRTNSDASYLRLKLNADDAAGFVRKILSQLLGGLLAGRYRRRRAGPRRARRTAPDDFYSTTNYRTLIRHNQEWVEVQNQRMLGRIDRRGAGPNLVPAFARHP